MRTTVATKLGEMFLDYYNNFLTVQAFADYYGLTINEANIVIEAGRKIHENKFL